MEQSLKLVPEECEDLTLKYLPLYIERANQGEKWALHRLCDIFLAHLESNPKRVPPMKLIEWMYEANLRSYNQSKTISRILKIMKSGCLDRLCASDYKKERKFMMGMSVVILIIEGHTYEEAVANTATTFFVSESTVKRAYKAEKSNYCFNFLI